jgi:hypothetical protein
MSPNGGSQLAAISRSSRHALHFASAGILREGGPVDLSRWIVAVGIRIRRGIFTANPQLVIGVLIVCLGWAWRGFRT